MLCFEELHALYLYGLEADLTLKLVTTQTPEESLTPRGGAAQRTLRKRSKIEAFLNFQTESPRPPRSPLLRVEMAPISS